MDDFFKMDVFFVVATLATVVLAALLGLVVYRMYRILTYVERISKEVSDEAALLRGDIANARAAVREEGASMRALWHSGIETLQSIFRRRRK